MTEPAVVFQAGVAGVGVSPSLVLKVTDTEKDRLRRMQGVAGNIGLINPLVFNHFGYGTYAQVMLSYKTGKIAKYLLILYKCVV